MQNSFARLGIFCAKNHGSIFSKDFPDLTLKDPLGKKARWVELKAEEERIANLRTLRPKELKNGQLNKLNELGAGVNVGGLLAIEYVRPAGGLCTLHIMVPRHEAMGFASEVAYSNLLNAQTSRIPIIYRLCGQLVVSYDPTERSGREFDRFIWWALLAPWWFWSSIEDAQEQLAHLSWPTPLGLISWGNATFALRD